MPRVAQCGAIEGVGEVVDITGRSGALDHPLEGFARTELRAGAGGERWAFFDGWVETDARRRVLQVESLGYDGIVPSFLSRSPHGTLAANQATPEEPDRFVMEGTATEPDRLGIEVAYRVTVDGDHHRGCLA